MYKGPYLQVIEGGQTFLLPGQGTVSIEQQDRLERGDDDDSLVIAWHRVGARRWPVYRLGSMLGMPDMSANGWEHAVFLRDQPLPIGIAAQEIQLMPHNLEVNVQALSVIGNRLHGGSLFTGAWVESERPVLVFDQARLLNFLRAPEAM